MAKKTKEVSQEKVEAKKEVKEEAKMVPTFDPNIPENKQREFR